jgi:hypothetical protein
MAFYSESLHFLLISNYFLAYRNESGTFLTRKIVVKVALFYTKNRGESSTFLHHFIPSPWK